LSSVIEKTEERGESLKTTILDHLQSLEMEFQRYFSERKEEEDALVRKPFTTSLVIADIVDELRDKFRNLRNVSSARNIFHKMSFSRFW